MRKSLNDFYIESLEKRLRWGVEPEHGKQLAKWLFDARVQRLDQISHDLIVQEKAEQFIKRVNG